MSRRTTALSGITALLLLCSIQLLAGREVSSYFSTSWVSFRDELPSDYILSLDFDRYGRLWIGTENGMASFDGTEISKYMKGAGAISGNELNAVLADRFSDRVWFATKRDGFGFYDWRTGESVFFRHDSADPNSPLSNEITCLRQDDNGDIWFGTYTAGIGKYNTESGAFTSFNPQTVDGMAEGNVKCIEFSPDGKIYAGYYGEGFTVINPDTMTAEHYVRTGKPGGLPSSAMGCMFIDKDNNVWLGTGRGLALFRPVTKDFTVFDAASSGLPDGVIFSMIRTSDNRILASPDTKGLWAMDLDDLAGGEGRFRQVSMPERMRDIGIRSMVEDRYGNIYLGSAGKGLYYKSLNHTGLFSVRRPDDFPEKLVRGLAFSDGGLLLAGTDGGGISLLDSEADLVRRELSGLPDKNVISMYRDGSGLYWAGTFNRGVAVVDSTLRLRATPVIREVRGFCESGDVVWAASGVSGLWSVDKKTFKAERRLYQGNKLDDNYLKSICRDDKGRLWIGSYRSGLYIFDPDLNLVAHFNRESGFPSGSINHIIQDSRGDVWIATDNGLICFPDPDGLSYVKQYAEDNSMSSEAIMSVIEDKSGTIWFATAKSIGFLRDGRAVDFSGDLSFMHGCFSFGTVAMRRDGLMAFGSSDGIVFLDRSSIDFDGSASVHFSSIEVKDSRNPSEVKQNTILMPFPEQVNLKWHQNNMTVNFSADDFSKADNLQYFYRIDQFDKDWHRASGHSLSFLQLSPGEYTLRIRGRYAWSGTFGEETRINVRIAPPAWLSTPVLVLYALLFGILCFFIVRTIISRRMDKATIAQVREVNEEKLRFYTNITHELKTPLSLIIGPAEDMMADASLDKGARHKLALIYKNAGNLMELINKLLNFRMAETDSVRFNPTWGNMGSYVSSIGRIFAESNTNKNLEFRFDIDKDVFMDFDREIISSVLNNLLSNACKYTSKGEITLGLHTRTDGGQKFAVISVTDTGEGIAPDQLGKIFNRYYRVPGRENVNGSGIGLSIVQKFIEQHGGTISVESVRGKGSCFTVLLPMSSEEHSPDVQGGAEDALSSVRRILVVEDNADIRDYLSSILSDEYEVIPASNGEEGLAAAVRSTPDIIISDIMMPKMDGLEMCRRIKEDIRLSHIPVVLLTAKDTLSDKSEGYKTGADSYITKPFTSELIRARVANLISSRAQLARQYMSRLQQSFRSGAVEDGGFSPLDNKFLNKLTLYIEDNLSSENLDINSMALYMNVSMSSLYRKLKSLTGISANDYVRKIKLRKAAEMLASGEFNVSETAWNIGISSFSYFRQIFKEEFGCTPSEFKKRS